MTEAKEMYLDLMKKVLTFYLWQDRAAALDYPQPRSMAKRAVLNTLQRWLRNHNLTIAYFQPFDEEKRIKGLDWPSVAETMIGLRRLDNIQYCVETALKEGIPGDLIETGIWRGGAVIFMKAILAVNNIHDRTIWAADSFEGLPPPDENKYPADEDSQFHKFSQLRIGLEEVKKNFERYGLLDEGIQFLKGWFKDTLPKAPIKQLAVMRLDGDMYESTRDTLVSLYHKLSSRGFVIIDDYSIAACRQAVNDFRKTNKINDQIMPIDESGVFWRKGTF